MLINRVGAKKVPLQVVNQVFNENWLL